MRQNETTSGARCQVEPHTPAIGARQALGTTPNRGSGGELSCHVRAGGTPPFFSPTWHLTCTLHVPHSTFSPNGHISPPVVIIFNASRAELALLHGCFFYGAVAGTPNATIAHFSHDKDILSLLCLN